MKKILNHLKENWIRHGFETLVVTVGILLAFGLNNWNENRKNRIAENKILMVVSDNLNQNIILLEDQLDYLEQSNKSGTIILSVITNRLPDNDSLRVHWVHAIQAGANFTLSKSGYESMKNTGMGIISDDNLKTEIVNLHENTYREMERRQVWGLRQDPDKDTYLTKYFFGNRFHPRDYDFVVSDNYYRGLLGLALSQRNNLKPSIEESLEFSQRVLQLVQEELKE